MVFLLVAQLKDLLQLGLLRYSRYYIDQQLDLSATTNVAVILSSPEIPLLAWIREPGIANLAWSSAATSHLSTS